MSLGSLGSVFRRVGQALEKAGAALQKEGPDLGDSSQPKVQGHELRYNSSVMDGS